jgi:hypothetical protein
MCTLHYVNLGYNTIGAQDAALLGYDSALASSTSDRGSNLAKKATLYLAEVRKLHGNVQYL